MGQGKDFLCEGRGSLFWVCFVSRPRQGFYFDARIPPARGDHLINVCDFSFDDTKTIIEKYKIFAESFDQLSLDERKGKARELIVAISTIDMTALDLMLKKYSGLTRR